MIPIFTGTAGPPPSPATGRGGGLIVSWEVGTILQSYAGYGVINWQVIPTALPAPPTSQGGGFVISWPIGVIRQPKPAYGVSYVIDWQPIADQTPPPQPQGGGMLIDWPIGVPRQPGITYGLNNVLFLTTSGFGKGPKPPPAPRFGPAHMLAMQPHQRGMIAIQPYQRGMRAVQQG
jgi:hypothetical protein